MAFEFSPSHYSAEILSSVPSLDAEREVWSRIVDQEFGGNPFLSIDWQLLWLRHFTTPKDICFVKITERGGAAAGFFPLVYKRKTVRGVSLLTLAFAGNIYSPFTSPIVSASSAKDVVDYFAAEVLPALHWDLFSAEELPEEICSLFPVTDNALLQLSRPCVDCGEGNFVCTSYLNSFDEYLRSRRYDIRRNSTKLPERLAKLGKISFELIDGSPTEAQIAAYQEVYKRSWKCAEFCPDFHPNLMRIAAVNGWLRLALLHLDGVPIAAQLWLSNQQRGYSVKVAYDEEYKSFAPGVILTLEVIRWLIEKDRITSFDFLRGDENYKNAWADMRRQRMVLSLFRRNRRGSAAVLLDRNVVPALRRIPGLKKLKDEALSLSADVRRYAGPN